MVEIHELAGAGFAQLPPHCQARDRGVPAPAQDFQVRAGDVAIGITTSGNSENVIRGLQAAKAAGAITVGFTGEGGGRLAGQVDYSIFIPSKTTARIQEMHLMLGHVLCALLEKEFEQ